jgi:hypothetical protein
LTPIAVRSHAPSSRLRDGVGESVGAGTPEVVSFSLEGRHGRTRKNTGHKQLIGDAAIN